MTERTSSAGKLYNILYKAFEVNSMPSYEAWSYIFRSEEQEEKEYHLSEIEVSNKLIELLVLLKQALEDISQLEEPFKDVGSKSIQKMQKAIITQGLKCNWIVIRNEINEELLGIIKMCDGLLKSQDNHQKIITTDKSNKLLNQVNQLINDFCNSELPKSLKLELIAELRKIQAALINFDITGEPYLQKVCNEVIGNIITKSHQKPKLFKQFTSSIHKVVSIAVTIGGLMTTYDLSIKYQPLLTNQIMNLIENMPEEADEELLKLESGSKPQEMSAKLEDNTNNKVLPSGEEE